ncbi:MAG: flagellar hook-associated protein FlgK [Deltaproteobacteria bacterium]|nr:flagellar hook-associated protein FlgK [Deltaproteobacteria bacterium]
MPGVADILDAARRAIFVSQAALQVTGHNVANVHTPGYSRQEVVQQASRPLTTGIGDFGTGVDLTKIQRVVDSFLDLQVAKETQTLGRYTAQADAYGRVEAVFSDLDGAGINSALSDFFDSLQDLSASPAGQAQRTALISRAQTLADRVRSADTALQDIRRGLNDTVKGTLDEINTRTAQVAQLNQQILEHEANGALANDLRDRRTQLLQELSERIDLTSFEDQQGKTTVLTAGGRALVSNVTSFKLQVETDATTGYYDVKLDPGSGTLVTLTSAITGGRLKGLLELRDTKIASYRSSLDSLASTLVKEVNNVHAGGAGLNGYTTVTAERAVSSDTTALNSVGLTFPPVDGSFTLYVYNSSGAVASSGTVSVTAASTTLNNVRDAIGTTFGTGIANIRASIASGKLTIEADAGYSFAIASDSSKLLAGLGINSFFSGSKASDLAVSSTVANDTKKIAAGTLSSAGALAQGSNTNALSLAALRDSKLLQSSTQTFGQYHAGLQGTVGLDAGAARASLDHQQVIVDQVKDRREALSGVSLDEEMTNLIKFQHAFEAAARMVTVADEMLDTVIGMLR